MIKPLKLFLMILMPLFFIQPTEAQTVNSIDKVISDLYESLTFSEKQDPDYEKFSSLFIDGAHMISVKDTTSYKLTIQDFIDNMDQQRENGTLKAFKEFEIHRESDKYGQIQQVFSTYETAIESSEGSVKTRGINSIQLLREQGEWKIVSLIWYEENENVQLPKEYLPN